MHYNHIGSIITHLEDRNHHKQAIIASVMAPNDLAPVVCPCVCLSVLGGCRRFVFCRHRQTPPPPFALFQKRNNCYSKLNSTKSMLMLIVITQFVQWIWCCNGNVLQHTHTNINTTTTVDNFTFS